MTSTPSPFSFGHATESAKQRCRFTLHTVDRGSSFESFSGGIRHQTPVTDHVSLFYGAEILLWLDTPTRSGRKKMHKNSRGFSQEIKFICFSRPSIRSALNLELENFFRVYFNECAIERQRWLGCCSMPLF